MYNIYNIRNIIELVDTPYNTKLATKCILLSKKIKLVYWQFEYTYIYI